MSTDKDTGAPKDNDADESSHTEAAENNEVGVSLKHVKTDNNDIDVISQTKTLKKNEADNSQTNTGGNVGFDDNTQTNTGSNVGFDDNTQTNTGSNVDFDDNTQPNTGSNVGFDDNTQPNTGSNAGFDDNKQTNTGSNVGFDDKTQTNTGSNAGFDDNKQTNTGSNVGFDDNTQTNEQNNNCAGGISRGIEDDSTPAEIDVEQISVINVARVLKVDVSREGREINDEGTHDPVLAVDQMPNSFMNPLAIAPVVDPTGTDTIASRTSSTRHLVDPGPSTYMLQAVLVTLFCFPPTGLAAVYMAARTESLKRDGNQIEAGRASGIARQLVLVSLILGSPIMCTVAVGVIVYLLVS